MFSGIIAITDDLIGFYPPLVQSSIKLGITTPNATVRTKAPRILINIPVLTICIIVTRRLLYTMALGGVAAGSIKA